MSESNTNIPQGAPLPMNETHDYECQQCNIYCISTSPPNVCDECGALLCPWCFAVEHVHMARTTEPVRNEPRVHFDEGLG